jgi:hypothetical protein
MKALQRLLAYVSVLLLLLAACAKDKGNYDYIAVPDPVVSNLDTVYTAITGDSLVVSPKITLASGKTDYSCLWKIDIPVELRAERYEGKELRIVFGLAAGRYTTHLQITDSSTGMKYFYDFVIVAQTEFSKGIVVLSNHQNQAQLSFIKPDGTIRADIYQAINQDALPGPAKQLVPIQNRFFMNTLTAYWISYGGDNKGAVQIDANTLKRIRYLPGNFYDPPASVQADYMLNMLNGITDAVLNGKLYIGATETAPFWPYYGFFGVPVNGTYSLSPGLITNHTDQLLSGRYAYYFLAMEANRKAFVRFFNDSYYDTTYTVVGSAFNPKQLSMDILYMNRFNDNELYAFCDSAGKKVELKFAVDFTDSTARFTPSYKREFPGASLLTPATRWAASPIGIFFFSANDKIYRYNPLNNDMKPLVTDLDGKTVTILKVLQNGNLLIAGVQGSLYYLDISTGHQGELIKKIDGIPGSPADIIIRE